jgi:zinc and cadmium transporter
MSSLAWIIVFSLIGGTLSALAAGVYLLLDHHHRGRLLPHLVSLATGTLLGAAFIGLLPEALARAADAAESVTVCVLGGLVLFFVLEKMVIWRHCHDNHCVGHADIPHNPKLATGTLILIGDSIHNFVDGILIAAAFMTDFKLGVITSLAVATHEIPQELGDFAILLDSGFSRRKALIYNLITSLSTVVGAVLAWLGLTRVEAWLPYVLAVAASSFIYIAVADLIPGLHQRTAVRESVHQFLLISAGIGIIGILEKLMH